MYLSIDTSSVIAASDDEGWEDLDTEEPDAGHNLTVPVKKKDIQMRHSADASRRKHSRKRCTSRFHSNPECKSQFDDPFRVSSLTKERQNLIIHCIS